MAIITLTTDFGSKDHYVALVKAVFLKNNPNQQIVDINNHVRPFDIIQGALTVKNCYQEFPEGSIHIIGINAEPEVNFNNPEDSMMPCIAFHNGHYFVATDNGLFSLLFGSKGPEKLFEIDELSSPDLMVFPTRSIFAPAVVDLINGKPLEEIGVEKTSFRRALSVSPVIEPNLIRGVVVHIDHYGNLITNVTKEEFYRIGGKHNFAIQFRSDGYVIEAISHGYNEVPQGEKLALFNDFGFLEIAINKGVVGNGGGASTLFGMNHNDPVTIEFYPPGSKQTLESLF